MTPTPFPRIEIPYDQIAQSITTGVVDAFNDPSFQITLAIIIASSVIGGILAALGLNTRRRRR